MQEHIASPTQRAAGVGSCGLALFSFIHLHVQGVIASAVRKRLSDGTLWNIEIGVRLFSSSICAFRWITVSIFAPLVPAKRLA